MIVPMPGRVASVVTPQGKGGEVIAKPTPTPAPKKVMPKGSTPASRVNAKPNQGAPPKSGEAAANERTYWESIRSNTDPEDFKAYLKKYPNGQFADLAQNRIRVLEAAKVQPALKLTPSPTPSPEPAIEWPKPERDLPAPMRIEWGKKQLSFSVPSGWTRTQPEVDRYDYYLQVNFRAPDSPQTNISMQVFERDAPHRLRDGLTAMFSSETEIIDWLRKPYAKQRVSAKLTDTEVLKHPTGQWHTFTADVLDANYVLYDLALRLEAAYPDSVWKDNNGYAISPDTARAFNHARHSYYIRDTGSSVIVLLYTAPIPQFDDKLLPSVMATLRMSGGEIKVESESSDPSVSIYKYNPEVLIDGELKGTSRFSSSPVSVGKHHIAVRAKEHKSFEKDVFVGGWQDLKLAVKLERIPSSTSGANPK
jgi:hypothetical protein